MLLEALRILDESRRDAIPYDLSPYITGEEVPVIPSVNHGSCRYFERLFKRKRRVFTVLRLKW
jgi:hypothetical protein